jgi:hypothetical protein
MKIKRIAQNAPKQKITLKDVIEELSKDCYEVSSVDLSLLEKNLKKD